MYYTASGTINTFIAFCFCCYHGACEKPCREGKHEMKQVLKFSLNSICTIEDGLMDSANFERLLW